MRAALAGEPAGTRFHPQEEPGVLVQAVAQVREAHPGHDLGRRRRRARAAPSAAPACCPWGSWGWRAASTRATRWRCAPPGRRLAPDRQGDRELLLGRGAGADPGAEVGRGASRCSRGRRRRPCTGTISSWSEAAAPLIRPRDRRASRYRPSAPWRRSRSTSSPTRPWSATWAHRSWPRSPIAGTLITGSVHAVQLSDVRHDGTGGSDDRGGGGGARRAGSRRRPCGSRRRSGWLSPC